MLEKLSQQEITLEDSLKETFSRYNDIREEEIPISNNLRKRRSNNKKR